MHKKINRLVSIKFVNNDKTQFGISFQTLVKSIFIHVFDNVDIREIFTVKKILYEQFTQTNIHYRMHKGKKT